MCPSPSDADFFDQDIRVTWTRLAVATKRPGEVHITPPLTFSIYIIPIGTATFFNGERHDFTDFLVEIGHLLSFYIFDTSIRVDFGAPQTFVSINVTNARKLFEAQIPNSRELLRDIDL